jgi:hypothetical protein
MRMFEEDWRTFYPNAHPVGWMMRAADAKHWVRFHSLPLSKRYADTDAERRILLDRQNILANEVLAEGSPCWLSRTFREMPEGYIDHSRPLDPLAAWPKYKFELSFRFGIDDFDEEGEKASWNVFASLQTWTAGAFDDLLWAIASEEINATVWMSPSTGAVFAPYDGGVDLFLPTYDLMQELRVKHHDWLSAHTQGL